MLLDTENFSNRTGLTGVLKHQIWYIANIPEGLKSNHLFLQIEILSSTAVHLAWFSALPMQGQRGTGALALRRAF